MRRFILERSKNSKTAKPVKITRSVGLQVLPPGNRPGIRVRRPLPAATGQTGRPMQQQQQQPVQTPSPARSPVRALPPQQPQRTSNGPRQVIQHLPVRPVIRTANVKAVPVNAAVRPQPGRKVISVVDIVDDDDDISAPSARPMIPVGVRPIGVGTRLIRHVTPVGRPPLPIVNPRPRAQLKVPRHPAPLPNGPPVPFNPQMKKVPPKPTLKINKGKDGVVLSWNMTCLVLDHATVASYQIYAYQETSSQPPVPSLWKKVGQVNALPLPMACTLKQFARGNKYHFAVRATDTHQRQGIFSDPATIDI